MLAKYIYKVSLGSSFYILKKLTLTNWSFLKRIVNVPINVIIVTKTFVQVFGTKFCLDSFGNSGVADKQTTHSFS